MAWVRTDDNAPNHPKFFRAGVAAYGFWHACLSYCNRYLTDGYIPGKDIGLVFQGTRPEEVQRLTEILVREGLLEVEGEGYRMHDYLDYQPSKIDALKLKLHRIQAGQKGGKTTAKMVKQAAVANALARAEGSAEPPSRPVPSRPVPTREKNNRKLVLADEQFISKLKENLAYKSLDIDLEVGRLDGWLLTPRGKGKHRTQRRLVWWLNNEAAKYSKLRDVPARRNLNEAWSGKTEAKDVKL